MKHRKRKEKTTYTGGKPKIKQREYKWYRRQQRQNHLYSRYTIDKAKRKPLIQEINHRLSKEKTTDIRGKSKIKKKEAQLHRPSFSILYYFCYFCKCLVDV